VCLVEESDEEIIIPTPVMAEVDYFISQRLHPGILIALLDDISKGSFSLADVVPDDLTRIAGLVTQYAASDIGFVDAAVLALVERLKEPKLATLDHKHFAMMRPRHVEALTLLPE
jgi:predicted nucleic acid-binding protein